MNTAAVRDRDPASISMTNNCSLDDSSNRVPNAVINRGVAEERRSPLHERLHDIRLRDERQDRDLLRPEADDGCDEDSTCCRKLITDLLWVLLAYFG